ACHAGLRGRVSGDGDDRYWAAFTGGVHFGIPGNARRVRSESSVGGLGRAGDFFERWVHVVALPADVLLRDRKREKSVAAGFKRTRVGLHVAAGRHVAVDWHLSGPIPKIYREAGKQRRAPGQAGVSDTGTGGATGDGCNRAGTNHNQPAGADYAGPKVNRESKKVEANDQHLECSFSFKPREFLTSAICN